MDAPWRYRRPDLPGLWESRIVRDGDTQIATVVVLLRDPGGGLRTSDGRLAEELEERLGIQWRGPIHADDTGAAADEARASG
jgi:hypothetical protein